MFVFNRNEWNISFFAIDYHFIPVIFIFCMTGIFLMDQDKIEG